MSIGKQAECLPSYYSCLIQQILAIRPILPQISITFHLVSVYRHTTVPQKKNAPQRRYSLRSTSFQYANRLLRFAFLRAA